MVFLYFSNNQSALKLQQKHHQVLEDRMIDNLCPFNDRFPNRIRNIQIVLGHNQALRRISSKLTNKRHVKDFVKRIRCPSGLRKSTNYAVRGKRRTSFLQKMTVRSSIIKSLRKISESDRRAN